MRKNANHECTGEAKAQKKYTSLKCGALLCSMGCVIATEISCFWTPSDHLCWKKRKNANHDWIDEGKAWGCGRKRIQVRACCRWSDEARESAIRMWNKKKKHEQKNRQHCKIRRNNKSDGRWFAILTSYVRNGVVLSGRQGKRASTSGYLQPGG